MGIIKNRYKDVIVDTSKKKLIDIETGEIQEIKNADMIKRIQINEISVGYNEYVYLDTERLRILIRRGLKSVDLALLISISSRLLNRYNICMHDDEKPLKTSTIAKLVDESTQGVKKKLDRLVEEGLLAYQLVEEHKNWGKVFIVNPHFIRRGKFFKKFLGRTFDDITEDVVITADEAFK